MCARATEAVGYVCLIYSLFFGIGCPESVPEPGGASEMAMFAIENTLEMRKKESYCTGTDTLKSAFELWFYSGPHVLEWYSEYVQCVIDADDCQAVLACGDKSSSELCDQDPEFASCEDGAVALNCRTMENGDTLLKTEDCQEEAAYGGTSCFVNNNGSAVCGIGICTEEQDEAFAWCDGDKLMSCWGYVLRTRDCATKGLTCRSWSDSKGGTTWCGTGEECPQGSHCEGDTLVECLRTDEEVFRIDCAAMDHEFTCVQGQEGAVCGLPLGQQECEWEDEAFCEGDTIRICLFGKLAAIDCSTWMNGTCEEEPEGKYVEWFDLFSQDDNIRCVAP